MNTFARFLRSALVAALVIALLSPFLVENAGAVSTWNPTLLVNTESFQEIDAGDGSTNVELRFGSSTKTLKFLTTNKFQFSYPLSVIGNLSGSTLNVDGNAGIYGALTASGTIATKGNLTINQDADATDATATFGNASGNQTVKFLNTQQEFELSKGARINGQISGSGTLSIQNNINTRADIKLNADGGAADANLTFGNATADQTLKFSNANQRFEFSKDVKVTGGVRASGNLSGSTLTVDGNITVKGQTYVFPTNAATAGQVLKNNGSNTLTWSSATLGNGSGNVVSLHPAYPGAIYYQSGSTAVGTLVHGYDATNAENYYRWSTSKSGIQDYWVGVRVQVPKNFAAWDPVKPLQVRLRTTSTSAANNAITVRLLDTAGAAVTLTGNASLTSSSGNTWRTQDITLSGGTFTPEGYITILVKAAALTGNTTDLGFLNVNWSTTTP